MMMALPLFLGIGNFLSRMPKVFPLPISQLIGLGRISCRWGLGISATSFLWAEPPMSCKDYKDECLLLGSSFDGMELKANDSVLINKGYELVICPVWYMAKGKVERSEVEVTFFLSLLESFARDVLCRNWEKAVQIHHKFAAVQNRASRHDPKFARVLKSDRYLTHMNGLFSPSIGAKATLSPDLMAHLFCPPLRDM